MSELIEPIEGLKYEVRTSPTHPRQDFWGCAKTKDGDVIVFVADGVSRPFSGTNQAGFYKDYPLFEISPDGKKIVSPYKKDSDNQKIIADFNNFSDRVKKLVEDRRLSLNPPRALAEAIFLKLSQLTERITKENIVEVLKKIMKELVDDPLLKGTLEFFSERNPHLIEAWNNPLLIATTLGLVAIPEDQSKNPPALVIGDTQVTQDSNVYGSRHNKMGYTPGLTLKVKKEGSGIIIDPIVQDEEVVLTDLRREGFKIETDGAYKNDLNDDATSVIVNIEVLREQLGEAIIFEGERKQR